MFDIGKLRLSNMSFDRGSWEGGEGEKGARERMSFCFGMAQAFTLINFVLVDGLSLGEQALILIMKRTFQNAVKIDNDIEAIACKVSEAQAQTEAPREAEAERRKLQKRIRDLEDGFHALREMSRVVREIAEYVYIHEKIESEEPGREPDGDAADHSSELR